MRIKTILLTLTIGALALTACPTAPGGGGTPPPTTVLPTLTYTGTATKSLGCFSGLTGSDTWNQVLGSVGSSGQWNFGFQGCTALATESVAFIEGPGNLGQNYVAPDGYLCRFSIDGTSDATTWWATSAPGGSAGGTIFLESSSAWPTNTGWTITCIPG